MYQLIYSDSALKQLEKLEFSIRARIISTLERIRIRPEVHIEKLVGRNEYKLKVGDYRIILDLDRTNIRILLIEIGHRKNIYY